MNRTIRTVLCGLALLGLASAVLKATEPAAPRARGSVLVLENERTMEGDIQRVGDDYRIRRSVGEVWVPGAKVLRLCADWVEAYAYLRSRANLGDSDERIRLARWCQLHNLKKEALSEASAAVELRPYSDEARRLQNLLKRAVAAPPTASSAAASQLSAGLAKTGPTIDLSAEAMSAFVTRVQPILMNACASCHVNNRGGKFNLLRCYQGGALNQRATRHNLVAVMAEIDRKRPELSPLLIKAVSGHGKTSAAPLKGREAPAYRHLQSWVETTLATNPQLGAPAAQTTAAGAIPAPGQGPATREEKKPTALEDIGTYRPAASAAPDDQAGVPIVAMSGFTMRPTVAAASKPDASKPAQPTNVSEASAVVRPTPKPEAPPPPEPVDEFDAIIFNRQTQPQN
jgi:hypothetical protein